MNFRATFSRSPIHRGAHAKSERIRIWKWIIARNWLRIHTHTPAQWWIVEASNWSISFEFAFYGWKIQLMKRLNVIRWKHRSRLNVRRPCSACKRVRQIYLRNNLIKPILMSLWLWHFQPINKFKSNKIQIEIESKAAEQFVVWTRERCSSVRFLIASILVFRIDIMHMSLIAMELAFDIDYFSGTMMGDFKLFSTLGGILAQQEKMRNNKSRCAWLLRDLHRWRRLPRTDHGLHSMENHVNGNGVSLETGAGISDSQQSVELSFLITHLADIFTILSMVILRSSRKYCIFSIRLYQAQTAHSLLAIQFIRPVTRNDRIHSRLGRCMVDAFDSTAHSYTVIHTSICSPVPSKCFSKIVWPPQKPEREIFRFRFGLAPVYPWKSAVFSKRFFYPLATSPTSTIEPCRD